MPNVVGVPNKDVLTVADSLAQQQHQIENLEAQVLFEQKRNLEFAKMPLSKKAKVAHGPMGVLIRDTIKEHIWCSIKLISSAKQSDLLAEATLKAMELGKGKFDAQGVITQEGLDWCKSYSDIILRTLNDQRSSCQNAMKTVCIDYMKANKLKALPSNKEFLKILERDPACDQDLFVWWWGIYMPKAAGTAKHWNKTIKYFGTLSEHAPPGKPNQKYIRLLLRRGESF